MVIREVLEYKIKAPDGYVRVNYQRDMVNGEVKVSIVELPGAEGLPERRAFLWLSPEEALELADCLRDAVSIMQGAAG